MAIAAESVIRSQDVLGECTIWCDRDEVLWWVDIRGPSLKRYNPANGEVRALSLSEAIGSFGLTRSGKHDDRRYEVRAVFARSGLRRAEADGGAGAARFRGTDSTMGAAIAAAASGPAP